MSERTCANCVFFHPEVTNTYTSYPDNWAGECRANGPQMQREYDRTERFRIFPIVGRKDWCGLFSAEDAAR